MPRCVQNVQSGLKVGGEFHAQYVPASVGAMGGESDQSREDISFETLGDALGRLKTLFNPGQEHSPSDEKAITEVVTGMGISSAALEGQEALDAATTYLRNVVDSKLQPAAFGWEVPYPCVIRRL